MFKMKNHFEPEMDPAAAEELAAYKRRLAAEAKAEALAEAAAMITSARASYAMRGALRDALRDSGAKNPTLLEAVILPKLDISALEALGTDEAAMEAAARTAAQKQLAELRKSDAYLFSSVRIAMDMEEDGPFDGFEAPDKEAASDAPVTDGDGSDGENGAESDSEAGAAATATVAAASALKNAENARRGFFFSGAQHGGGAVDLAALSDEEYYRATVG